MSTTLQSRPAPAPAVASRGDSWPGWVSLAGRFVLAGVFLVAAASKLADSSATVRAVRAYQLLPESLVAPFAHALPAVEIALAIVLFAGLAVRLAGVFAAILLTTFTIGVISAAARGLRIDCGCFGGGGTIRSPNYTWDITRDLLLLAIAVLVALIPRSRLAIDSRRPRKPAASGHGPRVHGGTKRDRRDVRRMLRRDEEQRRVARRRRWHAGTATGIVVLAAPLGILANVGSGASNAYAVPPGVTAAGGVLVGSSSAGHHVILFEDPQCPACERFEQTSGPVLAKAVADGRVQVEYRMRSFLGPESVRADAALAAAISTGRFEQLREALYANQPPERSGGYPVDMLVATGHDVGIDDPRYDAAVRDQTYAPWVRWVDDRASRDGDVSTPELRLDGHTLDSAVVFDPVKLAAALAGTP